MGKNPKRALVEGRLMQVVRDCGQENEELAQRVLYALTEEPEKRPAKTRTELQREVRLESSELALEELDLAMRGDLDFVLKVPTGAGLAFEIPASPEVCYQLIHDYLVQPIRQQFGGKLEKQLEAERKKRKQAEENLKKRNHWLLWGSVSAAGVFAILGGIAFLFALQANEQKLIAQDQALNSQVVNDNLILKGVMDDNLFSLEAQVAAVEDAKEWQDKFLKLKAENRWNIMANLHQAASMLKEKNRFQGHQYNVTSVAFAPDGKSLLTGSDDKTAKLWSIDGKLLQTFQGHQDHVTSVAFAPDGKSLLTGSWDKTAKLWSIDGKLLQTFQGHQAYVNSVAFSPDGKSLLTGSWDKTAKLWSINGKLLQTFQGHQSTVYSVAFSPDGKSLLTGSWDKTAKLWSIDGKLLQTFQGHQDSVSSVAFAPDGKIVLTGSKDKTAKLWSIDGRLLQTFQGHQDSVTSVAFAPDGKRLLTGSIDKTAKLWSIDGKLLQTFQAHQYAVTSAAFAPDGKSLLTGSWDKTAKLWSIDGKLLQTFQVHQDFVNSFAFNPDGKSLLTGSWDKTAKLWSIDGKLLQTFQGHQDHVTSVAFAPDGKSLLTGSKDKTAKLWDLNLEHSLAAMCDHLHDFASLISNPTIPEEDRKLRQRAKTACEGIPPPKISFNFLKNGNLTLLSSIFIGKRD
ncbi:MAG: hypothetical protein IM470_06640 [Microcystis sp. M158S2]|nr:hypothetical protein [Microcystis sp. M158S2]